MHLKAPQTILYHDSAVMFFLRNTLMCAAEKFQQRTQDRRARRRELIQEGSVAHQIGIEDKST